MINLFSEKISVIYVRNEVRVNSPSWVNYFFIRNHIFLRKYWAIFE
jgi:hypothetical protein